MMSCDELAQHAQQHSSSSTDVAGGPRGGGSRRALLLGEAGPYPACAGRRGDPPHNHLLIVCRQSSER
jgi:hypothetical protein